MEENKTKKYYLKYTIDDEGYDDTIQKDVDFVSDNLYDYPELEIGGPVALIEEDTKTGETKVLHGYIFVDEERSIERFGSEPDKDGCRTYYIYESIDTINISPVKADPTKVQAIDAMYYLMNYDKEHQKRVEGKKDNKGKKFYLSYNKDEKEVREEVEFASDNIYDYDKLECGSVVDVIEVDTETGNEKVLHKFIFVQEDMSAQFFGAETDEEGYRAYFVLDGVDEHVGTSGIAFPLNVKVSDYIVVDGETYIKNYDKEHQKRVEERKKAEEEEAGKKAGQPGDDE